MDTMMDKLFTHKKNSVILFLSLFLFGCQTTSHTTQKSLQSSSTYATPQVTDTGSAPQAFDEQENFSSAVIPDNPAHVGQSAKYAAESFRLQQCQSQLDVMKVVSPEQYARMHQLFDRIMKGAAQYADVRAKINADTQDTVDALYRYRANLICAQIGQKLLEGLTRQDEVRP